MQAKSKCVFKNPYYHFLPDSLSRKEKRTTKEITSMPLVNILMSLWFAWDLNFSFHFFAAAAMLNLLFELSRMEYLKAFLWHFIYKRNDVVVSWIHLINTIQSFTNMNLMLRDIHSHHMLNFCWDENLFSLMWRRQTIKNEGTSKCHVETNINFAEKKN